MSNTLGAEVVSDRIPVDLVGAKFPMRPCRSTHRRPGDGSSTQRTALGYDRGTNRNHDARPARIRDDRAVQSRANARVLQASASCFFVIGAMAMGLAVARFFSPRSIATYRFLRYEGVRFWAKRGHQLNHQTAIY